MSDDTAIFVGASDADQYLLLKYANRHGLIAGATGTGKTVTPADHRRGFFRPTACRCSWPTSKATCRASARPAPTIRMRSSGARQLKIDGYAGRAFPAIFWDLFGEQGPSGAHDRHRDRARC